jgi:superfamily II DNA or RNA helicase
MKTLHDYQWEAVCFLSEALRTGSRKIGLVMPTGAGKSLVLSVLLNNFTGKYTSAVVATPLDAIKNSFTGLDAAQADAEALSGTGYAGMATFDFASFWRLAGNERVKADREAFASHVRHKPTSFALVTTHSALRTWTRKDGKWALPASLKGRALVIDEAHHTDVKGDETMLAEVATEWYRRGGVVISTTATPFRNNGESIFDDSTVVFTRTIAEHSRDLGMQFQMDRVVADGTMSSFDELIGEKLPKASKPLLEALVARYRKDGCPKVVCIVPANGSEAWAESLTKAFKKANKKVRVHNAVGIDNANKHALNELLEAERKVSDYDDSQVDVILACRRFNEGSDWPPCSHVYNIGLPRSYGLLIQRWGRAMRDKRGIANYPTERANKANLTFFLSTKISKDTMVEYEKKSHNTALLIALFMADHETAGRFAAPPPKESHPSMRDVSKRQSRAIPDHIRQEAQAAVLKQAVRLGPTATEADWTKWVAGLPTASQQNQQKQRAAVRILARSGAITRSVSSSNIDQKLSDEFDVVAAEYSDKTASDWTNGALRIYTEFTGETAEELKERLCGRQGPHAKYWTLADIDEAIRLSMSNGVVPRHVKSRARTAVVAGDICTWVAVDLALRYGNNGLSGGDSLAARVSSLYPESAWRTGEWDQAELEKLVQDFIGRTGRIPQSSTREEVCIQNRTYQWSTVVGAFSKGTHGLPTGGFPLWCAQRGMHKLRNQYGGMTVQEITQMVAAHIKAKGRPPSAATKDSRVRWDLISARANALGSSLKEIKASLGVTRTTGADVPVAVLNAGVLKFFAKFGRAPSSNFGSVDDDASEYLGYAPKTVSWRAIYRAHPDTLVSAVANASTVLTREIVASGVQSLLEDNPGTSLRDHLRTSAFPHLGIDILWSTVRDRVSRGEVVGCPRGTRMSDVSGCVGRWTAK